jgi:predicted DCC family thiol-disulfide oxidoreductase YuxK
LSESGLSEHDGNWLLYDGDCPFCNSYVALARFRALSPGFRPLDARRHPALCTAMRERGFDIDRGMVLSWRGRLYYGADAMWMFSRIDRRGTVLATVHRIAFRSRTVSRRLYPVFKTLRAFTLRATGRSRITPPAS